MRSARLRYSRVTLPVGPVCDFPSDRAVVKVASSMQVRAESTKQNKRSRDSHCVLAWCSYARETRSHQIPQTPRSQSVFPFLSQQIEPPVQKHELGSTSMMTCGFSLLPAMVSMTVKLCGDDSSDSPSLCTRGSCCSFVGITSEVAVAM